MSEELHQLKAEIAHLRAEREWFELSQKAARIGTFEWFFKENRVVWTPELEALYGLPPGSFEGKYENWVSRLHVDDRPKALESLRQVLNKGVITQPQDEFRAVWPDGSVHWLLAKGQVLLDEQGQPFKMVGINLDIDDRKQAEERAVRLQEVTAALSYALNPQEVTEVVVKQGLSVLGAGAGSLYQLEPASPPQLKLMGWSGYSANVVQSFLTMGLDAPTPLAQAARTKAAIWLETRKQKGEYYPHLKWAFEKAGTSSIAALPLIVDNQVIGVIGLSFKQELVFDEATRTFMLTLSQLCAQALERARLYQQAQELAKTQTELNQLKDVFMSVASHELRNPLTVIYGYTQVVESNLHRLKEAISPQKARLVERTLHATQASLRQMNRMDALIQEFLDFSRIQNHKFELHYSTPVDLLDLTRRVVEQQTQVVTSHQVKLETRLEPGKLLAQVDDHRIEQVLINLISNAVKYSPAQTRIVVGIDYLTGSNNHAQANLKEEYALIRVQDQGYGIAHEDQPHLFELFYRVANPRTEGIEGLGLGLYISHEIVKQHGGRLWVESQPGAGSAFYFTLPLLAPSSNKTGEFDSI